MYGHLPCTILSCRSQVANPVLNPQWRKEKYHADTALSLWDEICRLNPIVSLASLNDRRLGRALKAAEVIRAHPFTQVRDIYEISYDMWLASAQYQHLKIVERESHLSPSAPRRDFTKDFVLSRNMKEPIAGLKLRRLVDPGYPRYLKDLKNQLTSLKKLLKHKVSKAKKPQSQ